MTAAPPSTRWCTSFSSFHTRLEILQICNRASTFKFFFGNCRNDERTPKNTNQMFHNELAFDLKGTEKYVDIWKNVQTKVFPSVLDATKNQGESGDNKESYTPKKIDKKTRYYQIRQNYFSKKKKKICYFNKKSFYYL